jgi:hypothetical protein
VRDAGFETGNAGSATKMKKPTKEALDYHGLGLILGHRPFNIEDTRATVERAVRLAPSSFLRSRPAPTLPLDEGCETGH